MLVAFFCLPLTCLGSGKIIDEMLEVLFPKGFSTPRTLENLTHINFPTSDLSLRPLSLKKLWIVKHDIRIWYLHEFILWKIPFCGHAKIKVSFFWIYLLRETFQLCKCNKSFFFIILFLILKCYSFQKGKLK